MILDEIERIRIKRKIEFSSYETIHVIHVVIDTKI